MILELPIIESLRKELSNYNANPAYFFCLFVLIPCALFCSLICFIYIYRKLKSLEKVSSKLREMSSIIHRGAKIYLKQQARTLCIFLLILFIPVGLTGIGFLSNIFLSILLTGCIFLVGALCSLIAGYIGMTSATKINIYVIDATSKDSNEGFKLAYYGGMITGLITISMLIFGIWIILVFSNSNIYLITGFSFGASVAALLAQVGGGIYTKSADIAADMVGKYELNIKEDDPSNPAIFADLIGDNVGDCAARGADLFESASSDAISGMILGLILFRITGNPIFIITNLTIIAMGLFSLFITMHFLKVDLEKPTKSIWKIFIIATLFNIITLLFLNLFLFGTLGIYLFFASFIGLITTFITILIIVYYTSIEYTPTKRVAEASQQSPSLNILAGISSGLHSTFLPIIIFVIASACAFYFGYIFGQLYIKNILNSNTKDVLGNKVNYTILLICFGSWGLCMASASSDLIISTVLSFDTFGPIMDNAAGIVELGGEENSKDLRLKLDKFDAIGNTVKAISKGFALICGAFSSLVLFLCYLLFARTLATELPTIIPSSQLSNILYNIHIFNPLIIGGIFLGAVLPFFFVSYLIRAVQGGANNMVKEVRRQFNETPGLKEGKTKPDYDKCINIAAKNALRNMLLPVSIVIVLTISVGILLGPFVIAAFLIGNLISCLIIGLFFSIGGATLDNAKKGIEGGLYGGKGSFAHKSAIIGDTVGDPLKDTAGPSMNIMIKTVNTISLTFLPLFIMTGFLWNLLSI